MKIEISKLREELQRKNEEERILKKYDCYIIREINNLSEKEAEKIKDEFGDVILVKNLTLPSKSVAHLLKKQHINIIIYEKGKKLADKLTKDGFTLINSKEIKIQEKNNIKFVLKEEVEKAIKSAEIVEKIIEEYRSKRH